MPTCCFPSSERGFSNTQLERIMRTDSASVSSCIEKTVKPKFKVFEDLGFSASEVVQIIASNPRFLYKVASQKNFISLSVLKGILGSNANLVKISKRFGNRFSDLEKTLLPNIEFLKSCGVPVEQIGSLICTFPSFFRVHPDTMRKYVLKVDEMGVERTSGLFIYAVRAVSSMSDDSWELKLKAFRDLGFSDDDILRVFRVAPMVISVSTPKLKKVTEILLETRKYDMSCIVNCPVSLMSSVEKIYKPRLQVLNVLEKKGLIKNWPSLSVLSISTDEMFSKRFVAPYGDEVREAFVGKTPIGHLAEMGTCDHK